AAELLVDDAAVALLGVEVVGLHELHDVRVEQQGQEHHEARDRHGTDGLVHDSLTTWVSSSPVSGVASGAGRRVWSLMRRSSATMIQFMMIEEPPAARNGAVRPVSGMRRMTPPATTKTWSANETDRPTASSLP